MYIAAPFIPLSGGQNSSVEIAAAGPEFVLVFFHKTSASTSAVLPGWKYTMAGVEFPT